MPTNITDVDAFTDPVVVPVGGDPRTAASVQTPFQALSNRTRFLYNMGLVESVNRIVGTGPFSTVAYTVLGLADQVLGTVTIPNCGTSDVILLWASGSVKTAIGDTANQATARVTVITPTISEADITASVKQLNLGTDVAKSRRPFSIPVWYSVNETGQFQFKLRVANSTTGVGDIEVGQDYQLIAVRFRSPI